MKTDTLSPRDLQQIQYVTRNYGRLQGLRMLPFGVALLLATPLYGGWQFTQSGVLLALWLLPVAVGVALWWLVGWYYVRTFGQVQSLPQPRTTWREEIIVWGLLLAGIFLSRRTGSLQLWLVPTTLALLAMVLFALQRSGQLRLRLHWVVLSTVLAIVNLALLLPLPALRPDRWPDHPHFAIWIASIGVALIVGGLLDHKLLLRTLGTPVEDGHEPAV